jgi:hypothetical protein
MPGPPQYPASLAEAAARATAEASRRWARAATSPGRGGRIVTAATLAWESAYPIAYTHGYTTLASRAAAAFQDLGPTARELVEAARGASPYHDAAPSPPRRVLEVAAIAALNRRDGATAPESITEAVHREAVIEGGLHGALTAAGDIATAWRIRANSTALTTRTGQVTLAEHANMTLAALNRAFSADWVTQADPPPPNPPALARSSFAIPATGATASAEASPTATMVAAIIPARRRGRA